MSVVRLSHYDIDYVFNPPRISRGFIERDYFIKTHTQGFYEINIVLCGTGVHYIGSQNIEVSAGDTFIVPPNVPHAYEGGQGFDVYHLLLHPKYIEKNSASLSSLPAFPSLFIVDPLLREKATGGFYFKLDDAEISELYPNLTKLTSLENKTDAISAIIADSNALIIIATLCDIYNKKAVNKNINKPYTVVANLRRPYASTSPRVLPTYLEFVLFFIYDSMPIKEPSLMARLFVAQRRLFL
jgi:hypothetical protein